MTELETAKLIAVITEVYPRFLDGRNLESTIIIWQKIFAGDAYAEVEAAFYGFVSTDEKGFPPAPGAIRVLLGRLQQPEGEMTETEAWSLVQKATRNSLYNSDKEFAALPEEIQRCVGSAATLREWAIMDSETFNTVVASNFMRGFKARAGHVREMQKLPPTVREVFGLLGDAFKLPGEPKKPQAALPSSETEAKKPEAPSTGEGYRKAKAQVEAIREQLRSRQIGGTTY